MARQLIVTNQGRAWAPPPPGSKRLRKNPAFFEVEDTRPEDLKVSRRRREFDDEEPFMPKLADGEQPLISVHQSRDPATQPPEHAPDRCAFGGSGGTGAGITGPLGTIIRCGLDVFVWTTDNIDGEDTYVLMSLMNMRTVVEEGGSREIQNFVAAYCYSAWTVKQYGNGP